MSGDDTISLGNLQLFRSLYDFQATYTKTISFNANEYFILHRPNVKNKNWWDVITEKGDTGFIPSNYVKIVNVTLQFYTKFINNALNNLKESQRREPGVQNCTEAILKLEEIRKQIEQLPSKCGEGDSSPTSSCYQNFEVQASTSSLSSITINEDNLNKCSEIKENNQTNDNIPNQTRNSTNLDVSPMITSQSVYELVESVRINTQLSHAKSRIAIATVVQGLHELLPASVFPYLSTILSCVQNSLVVDDLQIDQTHDASRLKIIFNELTGCKEDSQQRSWMLHEDEEVIQEYLTELISILSNADTSISKHVISSDQYHFIVTLIQFYQMETRWSIRHLLLQTFGVLCSLDKTVVNIMLNSVLPGELARDMMANHRNIAKLNYSSILLTMIFSMGEPMPITHHEFLDNNFLSFLFDNIEYPPDTDIDEQIPDLFLNCILSFNLQFEDCCDNPVMNALEGRDVAKTFTEKILHLINREVDPVRIFDHEPAPPHSVFKLFIDIFNRKSTAYLFYTNDLLVLIDIIVRNISDLSPGEQKRTQFIQLCQRLIRNTNYEEHRHRMCELLKCFTRILCEENELSKQDQKLVREISQEFPQLFK